MKRRPYLITDIDGVCLRWKAGLPAFLKRKGIDTAPIMEAITYNSFMTLKEIFQAETEEECKALLDEYNCSPEFTNLPAFDPKAIELLKKLALDFEIVALTCVGTEQAHYDARKENLRAVYGENTFSKIICIGINESKEDWLKNLADENQVAFFFDDSSQHVYEAQQAGVTAYQFVGEMREDRIDGALNCLVSWSEIYAEAIEWLMKQGLLNQYHMHKSPLLKAA